MTPEEKLTLMGIDLSQIAPPAANYVPYKRVGDLVYVSGQLPMRGGKVQVTGTVGREVTLEAAREAARLCAINILTVAKAAAGQLSRIEVIRLEGFVACSCDFTSQPAVINGASDLLVEILGEAGRHARFAVGVPVLPLGAPVEIAAILRITG